MGSCKPDPEHIWRKKSATAICGYWLWLWKCSDAFGLGVSRGVFTNVLFVGVRVKVRVISANVNFFRERLH